MFCVIFEVRPHDDQRSVYLDAAKSLVPELEKVDGFIENIRYSSLTRNNWILSLSIWRDEKSIVRWRTRMRHHEAQVRGRDSIFADYHLRVGQIAIDTKPPTGFAMEAKSVDQTEVGSPAVSLITMKRPSAFPQTTNAADCAETMGLDPRADGLIDWDVLESVLTPGDLILFIAWRDEASAIRYEDALTVPDSARLRRVSVVRDYGMFDRREAPQYYPDAKGVATVLE